MLEKVDFPLTNTQISDFFLEKEYTDYFTIQQVIHDLFESELIRMESTHKNTQYTSTPAGKETLRYFQDKISSSIQEDVLSYFSDKKVELKIENSILADYYKTPEQEYAARCQIKEKGVARLDFTLTVKTKEQAEAICQNWKDQSDDVYACLMDMLLK
jgi:DNA-binding PadR family transcriptional regulator